jgi:phenylalanyl-tRNA synthetase alpha subunit
MTEKRVENIATHRQKLADVVRHLKSESVVQFRTESAYAQAIIWASERLAELETLEEATDDESRSLFFCLGNGIEITPHGYCEAVAWGQNHIRHLEQLAKDIGEVLEQREKCLLQMHSYLRDRNETIYELKAEIKQLTDQLSSNPTNPESDEERHQRHRLERMLDKVTLICVHLGMDQVTGGVVDQRDWGRAFRDTASNICHGIMEYDANN